MKLCNGSYYYHCSTNTVLNTQLKIHYLKHCRNREIQSDQIHISEAEINKNLKNLKQVTFEITQSCTLHCKYCIYASDHYKLQREESEKSLSLDNAKKVINILWKTIGDRSTKKFTFGFFGGEPLLGFQVVKDIINYARLIFKDWELTFSITTNGVLLDGIIIRYLIENNFTLFISLDGNQSNHDSKRVFKNGGGSFETIIKNLEKIKTSSPDYYADHVFFSVVYSKDLPFEGVEDFFNSNHLVKDNFISLSFVNTGDSTYYEMYPVDNERFHTSYSKFRGGVIDSVKQGLKLTPLQQYLFDEWEALNDALNKKVYNPLIGACLYNSKFFVDVEGNFHICEKMNPNFPIGNVDSGFDIKEMKQIADDYIQLIESKCSSCEIRHLCSRCYVHFAKDKDFQMPDSFCQLQKVAIQKALEHVIMINQIGGFDK